MTPLLLLMLACSDKIDNATDTGTVVDIDTDTDDDTGVDTEEPVDADGDGVTSEADCDDDDPAVYPGADEVCDGKDNDCDTDIDEGVTATYYQDGDGDGYGDGGSPTAACEQPTGFVDNTGDCDDSEPLAWTGAAEACDGVDNDCDGSIDEDVTTTYYADSDGDGYGTTTSTLACTQPSGFADNADDCDDSEPLAWTGADEVCDGVDNDCDSATSEDGTVWFASSDGSGSDWTSTFTGDVDVEENGTLYICAGTWTVNLDIDVSGTLDVVGLAGSLDTVLDGEGRGTVVEAGGGDISLAGLTIQDGEGDNDVDGRDAGGGIACLDSTTLSGSDLRIVDNNATYYGGGFTAGEACDITLEDVEISGNTALYGAGGFAYDGTLSLVDATISDNSAAFYGGGFSLGSSASGTLAFSLEDSVVTGNDATYSNGGGIWAVGDTTIECTGSKGGSGGFYDNSAVYYGGAIFLSGYDPVLTVDLCDFGEDGTADDNTPQDVHIYSSYNYDDDVSFECIKGTCK